MKQCTHDMAPDLKPEEQARLRIDEMLVGAGWDVLRRQDYSERHNACAVREMLCLENHEADYLLYLDGKAIGVLEAKRRENSLGGKVAEQVAYYAANLVDWTQAWMNPLPFLLVSNGERILFRDVRQAPEEGFLELKAMPTPKELAEWAGLKSEFARLPAVPPVGPRGLRQCQYDAVSNLELSFKRGEKKALVVLATGAGKTFVACTVAYRLLNYTPARRILFLVDRNNLGKQAEGEFGTYRLTEKGRPFSDDYVVQRLHDIGDVERSNVVISTIHRLFAALTGRDLDETDDDESMDDVFSSGDEGPEEPPVEVGDDTFLPRDCFDLIVVDECHRSIYGKWKKVLDYFSSARVVGLTATPTLEALAFFNRNKVAEYTYDDSVRDGVNVPSRVYRIKTRASEEGGTIDVGDPVVQVARIDGTRRGKKQGAERRYGKEQLDRSIVNPAQIRLVVDEYRDAIYRNLYPERERNWLQVPKTLFFAKNDMHADNIVRTVRESFEEAVAREGGAPLPPDFVQKITFKAGNANQLIQSFRNERAFRIAVTVTLVATGTDVKPLEILVFMRDVDSSVLYTQMKGRGCRTIDGEKLRLVTPNAREKDCFYLVDAVGVTESEKTAPTLGKGTAAERTLGLEALMERMAHGELPDQHLSLFASYLSKVKNKGEPDDLADLDQLLRPWNMENFVQSVFDALSAEGFPPYEGIEGKNLQRKQLVSPVIDNPKARRKILEIDRGFLTILTAGTDELIHSGFSVEEAREHVRMFEEFIEENKDGIEALRIIYNDLDNVITYEMLQDLKRRLLAANRRLEAKILWDGYHVLFGDTGKVRPLKDESEVGALTNLIQLVRFALNKITLLASLDSSYASLFELYCGQNQRVMSDAQRQVLKQIAIHVVRNGCITNDQLMKLSRPLFIQTAKLFGPDNVNSEIRNLSRFLLGNHQPACVA